MVEEEDEDFDDLEEEIMRNRERDRQANNVNPPRQQLNRDGFMMEGSRISEFLNAGRPNQNQRAGGNPIN